MPLNENLEFSNAPPYAKKAFLGVPDKVWLTPGTNIYKWTDYPLYGSHGITEWWCYVKRTRLPSGLIADGFRDAEKAAHNLSITHRDFQKYRAAVSGSFRNGLKHLLLAELKTGVWGFAGKTAGQLEFEDEKLNNVYLIGGRVQLWIPGLSDSAIREIPSLG